MRAIRRHDFVEHVCDLLAPLGGVRAKAMFGGHGVYVDAIFCAIVANDTLYLKVDQDTRLDYEALGSRPFKPFDDKDMVMSYYEVPAKVMDDRSAILEWGRKAMHAALRNGTMRRAPRLSSNQSKTTRTRSSELAPEQRKKDRVKE